MSYHLWVISIYPPKETLHGSTGSGVGSYTKNLMTHMDTEVTQKTVIFCEYDYESSSYDENSMKIERCRQRKWLFSRLHQIVSILKKYPDLKTIHIHHEFNMFGSLFTIPLFLVLLWKLRAYHTIVTYHGVVDTSIIDAEYGKINSLPRYFPPVFLKFAFWFFYAISSKLIDTVIVHEHHFKWILNTYGFQDTHIKVLYHGVENLQSRYSPWEARKKLGIQSDKKVLLYFGFLAWYKGVDLLLDTFEKMDSDIYHLILAWGTPKRTLSDPVFRAWYEWVDQRAKTMTWVTRMGFVPDEEIEIIYSASDLLIIPYRYMLAASGPMSLALAYDRPFLLSKAFDPVISQKELIFDHTMESCVQTIHNFFASPWAYRDYFDTMKQQRKRPKIAQMTVVLYHQTMDFSSNTSLK